MPAFYDYTAAVCNKFQFLVYCQKLLDIKKALADDPYHFRKVIQNFDRAFPANTRRCVNVAQTLEYDVGLTMGFGCI
jgi:hypothetical protein